MNGGCHRWGWGSSARGAGLPSLGRCRPGSGRSHGRGHPLATAGHLELLECSACSTAAATVTVARPWLSRKATKPGRVRPGSASLYPGTGAAAGSRPVPVPARSPSPLLGQLRDTTQHVQIDLGIQGCRPDVRCRSTWPDRSQSRTATKHLKPLTRDGAGAVRHGPARSAGMPA